MRRSMLLWPLLPGLLALAGCDIEDFAASERSTTDFHYSYALKSGGRLSLENFNGSVEITGWDQETVDISGAKYAPASAPCGRPTAAATWAPGTWSRCPGGRSWSASSAPTGPCGSTA